jgi:hypothetical protein
MSLKGFGLKEAVLVFFCLAIAVSFFVFARNAYPVPGGDSEFFLVPALELSNRGVLSNPLFVDEREAKLIDPTGAKRFLFYPPLFPLLLSRGMTGATPIDIFITIALLNILTVSLCAWVFYRVIAGRGSPSWLRVFAAVLGLLALASGLVGGSGRPEVLGSLWTALGLLVYLYAGRKYDWAVYGVLLGLMFSTHLAGGVIALLVLGVVFASRFGLRGFFGRVLGASVIAFFTLFVSIGLGPFGFWETISGTVRNAMAVSSGYAAQFSEWFTLSKFVQYYFLSPVTPFYAFVVVLLLVSGWFFYRKYRQQVASPVLFVLCVIGLLLSLASMIYSVGHIFYLLIFAPVIFLGFIVFMEEGGSVSKLAVLATFILVSASFLRTALLFPPFLKEGPDFSRVRKVFAETTRDYVNGDAKFAVTGSFWSLSEDYDKMYVYNSWPEKPKENTALVFFQQKYSGLLVPPEVPGCGVLEDEFSSEAPEFLGVKLGNTAPGYGYAVYRCFDNSSQK